MSRKYKHIMSPLKVGTVILKSRLLSANALPHFLQGPELYPSDAVVECCFSQQEFADKAGVSIITIKRIESCKVNDIALSTLLKILRISGTLEGVVGLVPELPDSPFLINEKTGKRIQRINSKRKMA